MKIGILTFHSQLNYGGVLQAYALQEALKQMGHEVFIIDRWLDVKNGHLLGPVSFFTFADWRYYLKRAIFFDGKFSWLKRHKKTTRFVQRKLHRTSYHFFQWEEMKDQSLGLDLIVVGSDQVWNATFNDPKPYLLEGAPTIPAIAYAASFGTPQLPQAALPLYRRGFARFKAISCREAEGAHLVQNEGFDATHVVDPTHLLAPTYWQTLVKNKRSRRKTLVCYLLSEDIYTALEHLKPFVKQTKCRVKIFVNFFETPRPRRRETIKKWFKAFRCSLPFSNIKLCLSADPQDFLEAHATATWILTDSFHSVMFAAIFNKNVRFIRPVLEDRKAMFARVEEFAQTCVDGSLVADSFADALDAFARGEGLTFKQTYLDHRRRLSKDWLEHAIARATEKEE